MWNRERTIRLQFPLTRILERLRRIDIGMYAWMVYIHEVNVIRVALQHRTTTHIPNKLFQLGEISFCPDDRMTASPLVPRLTDGSASVRREGITEHFHNSR